MIYDVVMSYDGGNLEVQIELEGESHSDVEIESEAEEEIVRQIHNTSKLQYYMKND